MNTASFGARVRAAREAMGLSLEALGDRVGVGVSYLSDVERERRRVNEPRLEKICRALKLDVEEMAALAGVLGARATAYLRNRPRAIALIRRLAAVDATDEALTAAMAAAGKPNRRR